MHTLNVPLPCSTKPCARLDTDFKPEQPHNTAVSTPESSRAQLRHLGLADAVSLDLEGGDSFVSAIGAEFGG